MQMISKSKARQRSIIREAGIGFVKKVHSYWIRSESTVSWSGSLEDNILCSCCGISPAIYTSFCFLKMSASSQFAIQTMKLGLGPETVLAFSSRGIIFSLLAIVVATASVTNEKEVGKMGQKHLSPASKNTSIRVTKWIQNDTILPDGGRQQQHEGVDQLRFRKAHRRLYLNNSPEFFEIESDAEFQAYALGLRVHQAAATKEEGMTQCSGGTDDVQGSSTTTFCQFDGATCCDGGNFCCRRGSQCFSQATVMIEFVSFW
eukprot:jgi/Bigna1/70380/fgenesh1_pg.11_\